MVTVRHASRTIQLCTTEISKQQLIFDDGIEMVTVASLQLSVIELYM